MHYFFYFSLLYNSLFYLKVVQAEETLESTGIQGSWDTKLGLLSLFLLI